MANLDMSEKFMQTILMFIVVYSPRKLPRCGCDSLKALGQDVIQRHSVE